MLYIRKNASNTLYFTAETATSGSSGSYNIKVWSDMEGSPDNSSPINYTFTPTHTARKSSFVLTEPTNLDFGTNEGSFSYRITTATGQIVEVGKIRVIRVAIPDSNLDDLNTSVLLTHNNADNIFGGEVTYTTPNDGNSTNNTQYINI
tara:strand:- start:2507 stop:2950 length:444 start_codon:yes stop_codon:yes gene_type:complete